MAGARLSMDCRSPPRLPLASIPPGVRPLPPCPAPAAYSGRGWLDATAPCPEAPDPEAPDLDAPGPDAPGPALPPAFPPSALVIDASAFAIVSGSLRICASGPTRTVTVCLVTRSFRVSVESAGLIALIVPEILRKLPETTSVAA